MQENEKVLEIIGNVLDVYNGKEVTVKEVVVEPVAVVEPIVVAKVEEPVVEKPVIVEPVKVEVVAKVEPKVDEPKVVVKEEIKEPVKVVETPQPTMAELIAKGITEALKPYQDEISTLKEANKGLNDNKAFGLQGRPTKVDEIDLDNFSVENIYENSKK